MASVEHNTMWDPDNLDAVADLLREHFRHAPPLGYLAGRTQIRDVIMRQFDLSMVDAEALVDRLVAGGLLVFTGDPTEVQQVSQAWQIRLPAV